MPTAILRPSGVGTYDAWTLGAGASKTAAVDPGDPVAHDDDASYITIGLDPGVGRPSNAQAFYLDTGIPGTILGVSNLSLRTRAKSDGHADVESYFHWMRRGAIDGADVFDLGGPGNISSTPYSDAPGTVYRVLTTSPCLRPGGGTWAPSDFVAGNLQLVHNVPYDSALTFRLTSCWAELEYTGTAPGASGWVSLLWSVFGAAFGPLLSLQDVARAAGVIARTRGVRLSPDEVVEAWREMRAFTWPRTFDLAALGRA